MLKAVVVFCKTKGVDVDETSLRQQLGNIRIQRLKEESSDAEVRLERLLWDGTAFSCWHIHKFCISEKALVTL